MSEGGGEGGVEVEQAQAHELGGTLGEESSRKCATAFVSQTVIIDMMSGGG